MLGIMHKTRTQGLEEFFHWIWVEQEEHWMKSVWKVCQKSPSDLSGLLSSFWNTLMLFVRMKGRSFYLLDWSYPGTHSVKFMKIGFGSVWRVVSLIFCRSDWWNESRTLQNFTTTFWSTEKEEHGRLYCTWRSAALFSVFSGFGACIGTWGRSAQSFVTLWHTSNRRKYFRVPTHLNSAVDTRNLSIFRSLRGIKIEKLVTGTSAKRSKDPYLAIVTFWGFGSYWSGASANSGACSS